MLDDIGTRIGDLGSIVRGVVVDDNDTIDLRRKVRQDFRPVAGRLVPHKARGNNGKPHPTKMRRAGSNVK